MKDFKNIRGLRAAVAAGAMLLGCMGMHGQVFFDNMSEVEFGNEERDTLVIDRMLQEISGIRDSGDRIAYLGRKLLGTEYVAHTLEGETEVLRVRTDALDCTTFVDFLAAMSKTAGEGRTSWRDFLVNLRNMRYRGGRIDGYASRLHYNSEWVVENTYRGNIKDVTPNIPGCRYIVKTIDFMSSNRDRYPSLADSLTFVRIKSNEEGLRGHRFPYLKTSSVGNKSTWGALRNGDMLAFTSTVKNLDTTHMGIIVLEDGVPHVVHASLSAGKVVMSDVPVWDFLKRNRYFTGMRVFRLAE